MFCGGRLFCLFSATAYAYDMTNRKGTPPNSRVESCRGASGYPEVSNSGPRELWIRLFFALA